jgi:hypothetical protein
MSFDCDNISTNTLLYCREEEVETYPLSISTTTNTTSKKEKLVGMIIEKVVISVVSNIYLYTMYYCNRFWFIIKKLFYALSLPFITHLTLWALTQVYSKHCVPNGFVGYLTSFISSGTPMCHSILWIMYYSSYIYTMTWLSVAIWFKNQITNQANNSFYSKINKEC